MYTNKKILFKQYIFNITRPSPKWKVYFINLQADEPRKSIYTRASVLRTFTKQIFRKFNTL